MVADIRHFQGGEEALEAASASQEGLEELLERAARAARVQERMHAVEELRRRVPGRRGVETLWQVIEKGEDPRRLVAAQVLSYHREWLASPSNVKRLVERVQREPDAAVAAALVRCLRHRAEVGRFLLHPEADVAREAALGLPLGKHTLSPLLESLLEPGRPELKRILRRRMRALPPALVGRLVEELLGAGWQQGEDLEELLACLPQAVLFGALIEAPPAGWDPLQDARKDLLRRGLARLAGGVLERRPGMELLRYLLNRSSEDEGFARRHAAFLRRVLHRADLLLCPEVLKHLERLAFKASDDKLVRMAQLLVELGARLEGGAQSRARALLEEWKKRSPGLKLKIYHLQQGLS